MEDDDNGSSSSAMDDESVAGKDEFVADKDELTQDVNWNECAVLADVAHIHQTNKVDEHGQVERLANRFDPQQLVSVHFKFKEFCLDQISKKAKGWDSTKPLPWKTDPQLEHMVTVELQISKKQAAC